MLNHIFFENFKYFVLELNIYFFQAPLDTSVFRNKRSDNPTFTAPVAASGIGKQTFQ